MQNKFESNFTHKLYKKKLEEIRKFRRSIAKFKKIFKMKNEEFDNLSDKRFKDIVDAYKRNHKVEKKTNANNMENIKQSAKIQKVKSKCYDDLDIKGKTINFYDKITNNNENLNIEKKKNGNNNNINKKKIQLVNETEIMNNNDNYRNKNYKHDEDMFDNEDIYDRRQESVKRYQSLNKNNIHLFDFNSHPSKFFNQN